MGISRRLWPLGLAALWMGALGSGARAQMVDGSRLIKDNGGVFGASPASQFTVEEVKADVLANILWPGDKPSFTFRIKNTSDKAIAATGRLDIIQYGTRGRAGDVWRPDVFKIADCGNAPVDVTLAAGETREVTVTPSIPETFGGYALVLDLGAAGRAFAASVVRSLPAEPGRVEVPTNSMDIPLPADINEQSIGVFKRLGVKAARMEVGYLPMDSPAFAKQYQDLKDRLKLLQDNNISVMLTVEADGNLAPQPLDRLRTYLDADDVMYGNKGDYAWSPSSDADFQKWCARIATEFGFPKGPVNALELWNEPWEGISISGWGADSTRYREMYTRMAAGVDEARRGGARVRVGGACSSSNALDKFFADGTDAFLPHLDFVSIHYQPLAAVPSLIPAWRDRKSPYGPVQVWDTESWLANSEDRMALMAASMRAQGQQRANGTWRGNVFGNTNLKDSAGAPIHIVQAWPPAAAVAAVQTFLDQRAFKQILFPNGLPWIFVFDGLPKSGHPDPEDGTIVVGGDLAGIYDRNQLLFRTIRSREGAAAAVAARAKLAALPADAPAADRAALTAAIQAHPLLTSGAMTVADPRGEFRLFDFYGNPVPHQPGPFTTPLNALGYFLRASGKPGSFARLTAALKSARIEGYEPIEIIARDLTAPIAQHPPLRLKLTNILNRPVSGSLQVQLGGLTVAAPPTLQLAAHETREVALEVSGTESPGNAYPLTVTFDAGADGVAAHDETLHVDWIAHRAIQVDGKLDDWTGVPPQILSGGGIAASITEKAWLPFQNFDDAAASGQATGYLAYDDHYFYFAAKIADTTPYDGNIRFAQRDDNDYFYPAVSYADKTKAAPLTWPAGIRRYSYRKSPALPSGSGTDNVQIAFNVVEENKKPWAASPKGTMPGFMAYWDTDYEYALNAVAPAHGGGTEVWRLYAPGVPRKHFYPRQPKAKIDGGPVESAKLSMTRAGNTRIVELALPWSEIPLVRKRLDAHQTIKFSFRVNDNGGPSYELATGRSVSKVNFLAFHNDWMTHWANEVEFGAER
ncbi:hypothetical protein CCAX7_21330 [Capsulimonas corticalis]|uniref:Uncharacterized protein n=1 Tax=Capsulimonas corticalis TaxID=2219043 RepID=A0A402D1W9_9BACT|nr:hypothetical protein [Capsulimonas corticalis]BDI30082.1 hypothetical protein CCAX7_21330 [Capsulimonas corticalis]